jgi:rubredoxin
MNERALEAWVGKLRVRDRSAARWETAPAYRQYRGRRCGWVHRAAQGHTTPSPRFTPEEVSPLAQGTPRCAPKRLRS